MYIYSYLNKSKLKKYILRIQMFQNEIRCETKAHTGGGRESATRFEKVLELKTLARRLFKCLLLGDLSDAFPCPVAGCSGWAAPMFALAPHPLLPN